MRRVARLAGRILSSNLRTLPLPYRLTYAVTSRCMARCAMCNIWQRPAGDELSLAEIDALFERAGHFSWINLTGGELFQRPDIQEIFQTVIGRNRSLYLLNFPTNGYQTEDILRAVDAILSRTDLPRLIVSVSMDGPPGVHDGIRGIPECWIRAVRTFGRLREKRSRRFSVYFGHTVQAANLGTFDEMLRACDGVLGKVSANDFHFNLAHASSHYYDNAGTASLPDPVLAFAEIDRIGRMQSRKLLDPVAYIEKRYRRHLRKYVAGGKGPFVCQAASASCFIDPAGTVYPCTVFDAPIGSLRDSGMNFHRLWQSAGRSDARALVGSGRCPGCWTPCEAYQTLLANLLRPGYGT